MPCSSMHEITVPLNDKGMVTLLHNIITANKIEQSLAVLFYKAHRGYV